MVGITSVTSARSWTSHLPVTPASSSGTATSNGGASTDASSTTMSSSPFSILASLPSGSSAALGDLLAPIATVVGPIVAAVKPALSPAPSSSPGSASTPLGSPAPSTGATDPAPVAEVTPALVTDAAGDPASVAWSEAGAKLADLYAANAAGHAAPEALAAIERAATATLDETEGQQTAARIMAAAAYALVARGQAEQHNQVDLLK